MDLLEVIPPHSPKFLGGIDALYYRVKIGYDNYITFYNKMLTSGLLDEEDKFQKISYDYSGRFTNFRLLHNVSMRGEPRTWDFNNDSILDICTIRFRRLSDKDNLEELEIQVNSLYMNFFGYKETVNKIQDILSGYGLDFQYTKLVRVDLNSLIFGYDFSSLSDLFFSTRMASSRQIFEQNLIPEEIKRFNKRQTITLGSRKGYGLFYRLYNKTIELRTHDFTTTARKELVIKERFFNKYGFYPDMDTLWNSEFEIKRTALMEYKIDTLEDLFLNVNSLFLTLTTNRVRLLNTHKNQKNNKRLITADIWLRMSNDYKIFDVDIVPLDRNKFKKYVKDEDWLFNRLREYKADNSKKDIQKLLDGIHKILGI